MEVKERLIREIIGFLNENADYVVLRNYEQLPVGNDARDIDIIIRRKQFLKLRHQLVSLIDSLGWSILTYLDSDRLVTFVCAHIGDDGDTALVQWDFFFDTSVWGIRLMSADEFLADKEFSGFLWHSGPASKFLDKYLYDRAVGAQYPERYRAVRKAAEHLPAVNAKLKEIFSCTDAAACDKAGRKSLMLNAFVRNLTTRPLTLIGEMSRWGWSYMRNYIGHGTGFAIGFTGPDGAGKTTVIDMVIDRLGDVFRKAHAYYHFRPALFGNLGDVAQKAGVKKEVDRNYSDPHRGGRTSVLSSLARLSYYTIDYIAGYWIKVKSQTRITRLVIFDRYFSDIICDSRRSRIYLPYKFLNLWRKLLIPSLRYNILLTASTDTILSRKRELSMTDIEAINERIDLLAPQHGYLKVLNESSPDKAVNCILRHIFTEQHKINLRRLRFHK